MKPSEILDSAANILLRDGWYQGKYYNEPLAAMVEASGDDDAVIGVDDEANRTGPCCQEGAISRAIYGYAWVNERVVPHRSKDDRATMRVAISYMRRHVLNVHGVPSPIAWNDLPSTTRDDVVEALRGAAEAAREAGE